MSVCGVTEDYKENFQKAVLQKGGGRTGVSYPSITF